MRALDLTFEKTDQIIGLLKAGKVGVMPTDTIYGIVGSALNPEIVEGIYTLRKREKDKPFIILVSSIEDLKNFDVSLTKEQRNFLENNWPNPLSIILSVRSDRFQFLHRGKNSLAFRMPENRWLLDILRRVGPLVAPSANPAGVKPAETVEEAKKYFGDQPSFYIDGGKLKSKPSTIVQLLEDGTKIVLREGSFKV
ncbi:threonylcarbamoyl-AMP synthase [Candidatus Daviesbacteria bacterium RIFCSPHIGHO2_01_FULL_40_11]|uniref:L-threonylcarbamoyladenylate synthase n=1 Tax=Candidatus Daviesbacteria bacterium RIFCSPHIGHO2_01_FULL_40_11 TaxID=1797762 RepID=A0A1F5JG65_9BACT|nr:MAG: threonylcarbamoyl-AMP synthase [Candidatus Daviesbacteria bacterium RIFCSPHIGHO2_01_FULL_40_11]